MLNRAAVSLFVVLLLCGLAAQSIGAQEESAGAAAAVASAAIQGGRIRVEIGKSHLLQDVASYDITNQEVLEATAADDGSLILKGKNPGTTTLLIRKPGLLGHIIYTVDVIGVNVENVLQVVKDALGSIVGLTIAREGNVVVLEGSIVNRNDGKRIDRQIEMNGSAILDLTERVYMQNDLTLLRDELKRSKYEGIATETQIAPDGQRLLLIRGVVASDFQRESVGGIASKFFKKENIVDQVKVVAPQIEVDVEVYTVDMTRSRSIGTNTMLSQFTLTNSTGWIYQTGPKARILSDDPPVGGNIRVKQYPEISTGAFEEEFINALIVDDIVTNISKQHASVRSGETASIENTRDSYLAITSQEDASLEKVSSGQILSITPTVMETGMFETKVEVELSELAELAQQESLAVAKRNVKSVFVSGQEEKVVLGGTRKQTGSTLEDSTPILRWIPIVNWLFRAKSRQNQDVLQVFFMTLRTPNQFPAEDERQSEAAREQRDSIRNQMEKNKKKLDFWLRWN